MSGLAIDQKGRFHPATESLSSRAVEAGRRRSILDAAAWCFAHYGYAKTSFEDVAKRAGISRTLIYRFFSDKPQLLNVVLDEFLSERYPTVRQLGQAAGDPAERLTGICEALYIDGYCQFSTAEMRDEVCDAARRYAPDVLARYHHEFISATTAILGDPAVAAVFFLAFDGLNRDFPSADQLRERMAVLIRRFTASPKP